MAWCELGGIGLKKANVGKLAGELMAIVFSDSQGVHSTHYIPKDVNMNSVYYCKVLCQLKAGIHRKWSNLRNKQIFIIHDNVHPHFSEYKTAFLDEFSWFIFSRLTWHPMIFGYSRTSKISWVHTHTTQPLGDLDSIQLPHNDCKNLIIKKHFQCYS